MPYVDASDWAQEHLSGDEYIKAFGEPEGDDKSQTVFWLSGTARKKLDIIRAETGGEFISNRRAAGHGNAIARPLFIKYAPRWL